jgi:Na+-translocating ferredoxin:NAD+ oxidoreductase subunit D
MMPDKAVTPADELPIAPGPHLWRGLTTQRIMLYVIAALIPAAVAGIIFFGVPAVITLVTSIVFSVGTEWVAKKIRGRPFVMDYSAVLTGLLLAMVVPATLPWYETAIGAIFAIGIVKEAFGGLGHNIFNPALGARLFMAVSFGVDMTTWFFDGVTTATPLSKTVPWAGNVTSLLIGNHAGSLGETCAIALILGGLFLIIMKIIDWRIPVAYIGTVVILGALFGANPVLYLFGGGLMIGSFFMATDYVTTPVTHTGRIVFGIGCGIFTVVIRRFGGLPEGVAFSIVIMNSITPLIDRFVKSRPYGFRKAVKNAA